MFSSEDPKKTKKKNLKEKREENVRKENFSL